MKTLPPFEGDVPPPTPGEQVALVSMWNRLAPAKYRGLLEAENLSTLQAEKRKAKGRFVWDETRRVYIVARTGRQLSRREVRAAFLAFMRERGKQ